MPTNDPWDDWRNAEIYREYAEHFPVYRLLNRRLAELAEIGTARRVLDLACGTGATTAACLELLPADGEVVGVDTARAMVEVARNTVTDPRARFVHAEAESIDRVVAGPFDRAVCNAAFWMFSSPRSVLRRLRALVTPRGRLVFDLPAEMLATAPQRPHAFQVALSDAVGGEDRALANPPRRGAGDLAGDLDEAGFELVRSETFRHRARQRELIELMRIPAMAARVAPRLSPAERRRAVERAAAVSDPTAPVAVDWIFFVARRR